MQSTISIAPYTLLIRFALNILTERIINNTSNEMLGKPHPFVCQGDKYVGVRKIQMVFDFHALVVALDVLMFWLCQPCFGLFTEFLSNQKKKSDKR